MIPRWKERLGGAFIASVAAWMTWLTWHVARSGKPFLAVGVTGPAFVVLGLALIAFPGYRSERLARGEDIVGLEGFALLTPRWKGVLGVALAAMLGFYAWIEFG